MDKFAEAGYGQRDIGFGERPALVMVDFQQGFTDASNPLGRSDHVQRAVDNTAVLLAACKSKGVPVASCAVSWGGPDGRSEWEHRLQQMSAHFRSEGTRNLKGNAAAKHATEVHGLRRRINVRRRCRLWRRSSGVTAPL